MPERPIWRGHLRLALVSCPVALFSARHERGNLHFNLINPDTGNRIRMVTLDAGTEQEVNRRDLVRGYEFRKDHYVLLSDEDFDSVKVDSSSVLNIEKFVPAGSIDPLYFDAGYYLVPDGEAGEDVYAVLRDAIVASNTMALSRLVIARRERAVAILPMGRGLALHTLHEAQDLHDPDELFARVPDNRAEKEMVKLAQQLIGRQTGEYDPADMEDRYETRLRELIEAKIRGEGLEPEPEEEPQPSNVVDLMSALKKSLAESGSPAPARRSAPKAASPAKPAAKPAARSAPPAKAPPRRKRA
jgi:DNA end-binding protein Ku